MQKTCKNANRLCGWNATDGCPVDTNQFCICL